MIGERGIAAATSLSILLEVSGYHTGAPHDMEKTSFPPHSAHLSRSCGFKPCDRQNNLAHKSRVEVAACSRLHESSGHGFESGFHRKYGLARPIVLARSYILILEISTS